MSLFICEDCGNVENTATSRYWFRSQSGGAALCARCDSEFPRTPREEIIPWTGQIVLNPEVLWSFNQFKCDPDKCSHAALASPYHVGAKTLCPSCGSLFEVEDIGIGRKRMYIEEQDKRWKQLG